jgi:hypothetical protein
MTFSIRFTDQMWRGDGALLLPGELIFNDVIETFTAAVDPASDWRRIHYEQQWRDGLKRIMDGKDSSCLITALPSPSPYPDTHLADSLLYWPMYRIEDQVVFQPHVRRADKLPRGFNPTKPYRIVRKKTVKEKVSEWRVSFADIVDFYERMPTETAEDPAEMTFEKPEYFHPEEHTRAALETEFKSSDPDRIYAAFLNAAYYDDVAWVQANAIEALASPVAVVRWGALAALQILAAVRRELDPAVVLPVVMPLIDDPDKDVREVAKDVLGDIKRIFGQ